MGGSTYGSGTYGSGTYGRTYLGAGAIQARQEEFTSFITSDGIEYVLHFPPIRSVISEEGLGMPEINYITQRGPYQHGETLQDFFLRPRVLQYIIRHQYKCRKDYWAGRAQLIDILKPNRGVAGVPAPGVLRRVLPNGDTRQLDCIIQSGPAFAPRDPKVWDEVAYTEALRFIAYNPLWYDPLDKFATLLFTANANTFPMTFPVTFNGGYSRVTSFTYYGEWEEYPLIILDGPMTMATIINQTTGSTIRFIYPIADTSRVVIDLRFGRKTAVLDDTIDVIGGITADSDITTFRLVPGNNDIFARAEGASANFATFITLQWNNRYLGI